MKYYISLIFFQIFFLGQLNAQIESANYIASATPEATHAGDMIFSKGGNAVDAAVAIAFTLGVTEPAMSSIGGRTMLILSIPNVEPIAIGGITTTPSVLDKDIRKEDLTFFKQVSIPSQVKILNYVWKKYGSGNLKWEELLNPAISYAENGFVVGVHRHHVYKMVQKELTQSPYHNKELLIDNDIPAVGDLVKQPTLAKTLKRLAVHGAEDFYKGEIAKEIAEDFKNNGGWITFNDLSNLPEPKEYKALTTNYKGYDVYSFTPPGGGWQVLQALNLLEQFNTIDLQPNTLKRTLAILEVLNISHKDRAANAIKDYTNFQADVAIKISKSYAKNLFLNNQKELNKDDLKDSNEGETTHFSVVDKNGIAISVTSSVGGYFGAKVSTKELGFFYNSYVNSLVGFGFGKSLQPSSIIPSSMSPSLVRKDGKNVLVIGSPGSKRIVSTISQLIQSWIDSDLSIKELIKHPRIHGIGGSAYLEDQNISFLELQNIRERGYKIVFPSYELSNMGLNAYFGGVHAIEFKHGKWIAVADPRRDGNTNND